MSNVDTMISKSVSLYSVLSTTSSEENPSTCSYLQYYQSSTSSSGITSVWLCIPSYAFTSTIIYQEEEEEELPPAVIYVLVQNYRNRSKIH